MENLHVIDCNTTECKYNLHESHSCTLDRITIKEAECDSFEDSRFEEWNKKENN